MLPYAFFHQINSLMIFYFFHIVSLSAFFVENKIPFLLFDKLLRRHDKTKLKINFEVKRKV